MNAPKTDRLMKPLSNKGWTAILAAVLTMSFLCSCGMKQEKRQTPSAAPYHGFFDQSIVHEIDVQISDSDLQDQREHPLEKTKYRVDVTIDSEQIENVAFSTKGGSSLALPSSTGSCRYPFKLNFGKYEDDQTYYGLDKLNLSNLYDDPSGMRDWLAYRIMEETGVDAPLTSYVWLKINGEDMGLYLAVEDIDDSWLKRTGHQDGTLYKPEAKVSDMNLRGADDANIIMEKGLLAFFQNRIEQLGSPADSGAALVYLNDDATSYPDIFNNAEKNVTDADKTRIIRSLKALNDPEQCQSVLDTEEVLRYFAAHNFVLSSDSYTGLSAHNYYLLEQDGILSIYPWDYNNSFGDTLAALHPEMTRDEVVNWAVDAPLFDVEPQERPMWTWITEEKDSLTRYHQIMDKLAEDYFESGRFEKEIDSTYELIEPYQAKDPTAFFAPEASQESCKALKTFCMDRASSVRHQLD